MKRILCTVISAIMVMTALPAYVISAESERTAEYLLKAVESPTVASVGGEWTVIGLARSDAEIPESFYDTYYRNVSSVVESKKGILHQRKYTEYSRVVTALTAIGRNPEDVSGYNLTAALLDFSKVTLQGLNGAVWALIALDCGDYGNAEVRNKYVDYILSRENKNGGWSLSADSDASEVDVTAMALTALSRYTYRPDVRSAVDRGIVLLSRLQNVDGGYSLSGEKTSESTAQVLVAISSLGIPYSDERFVKNGNSLVSALMKYQKADGSFSHTSESDLMATEQCFYALSASERLMQNKTPLFDMSDTVYEGLKGKDSAVKAQAVRYPGKTFEDIKDCEFRNEIEKLSSRGIINGFSDSEFRPDRTMTRAEFSTIVVRALGLGTEGENVFSDVGNDSWYCGFVASAYRFGIVNGVSKNEFNPEGTITVEQACVMIQRAGKLCGIPTDLTDAEIKSAISKYSDGGISEWAKDSTAFCASKKLLPSLSGSLQPQRAITRGEVAYMLYKLLKEAKLS